MLFNLNFFRKINTKNFKLISLPKFDKSIDDRLKKNKWYKLKKKPDIVILEGWCIGARPQKNKQRLKGFSNKQREQANIRLKQLKDWRKSLGQELKLDPSLLWPTSSLSRLSRSPELFEQEFEQPEVRKWQIKEFGDSISQNVLNF